MGTITLSIDGQTVETAEGLSVLQAAQQAGIYIPTICDHKDLSPFGACRMCVVEIEGVRGFPTSCTTPASQGMQVRTHSEELKQLRNRTLELMFSGHPNSCLVCPHREACERYRPAAVKAARSTRCGFCANRDECGLRAMALEAGPRELALSSLYSAHQLERCDPFMDRDYNLCILCGRCWRICEKIHGKPAISIINRGKWARIGTAFDVSHVQSGCTFCGACIDICPTGTLTDRFSRWRGKPAAQRASVCLLCAQGCAVTVQSKDTQVMAYVMQDFSSEARLCGLGRFGAAQIASHEERLLRPLVREGGEQIPTDFEAALTAAAQGLDAHRGRLLALVSTSSTREDRLLYNRLTEALGGRCLVLPTEADRHHPLVQEAAQAVTQGSVSALILGGDFLPEALRDHLAFLVVLDGLPSFSAAQADVLLPVAILSECAGSFRNSAGQIRQLTQDAQPPAEGLQADWQVLVEIGHLLNLTPWDYRSLNAVSSQIENDPAPAPPASDPRTEPNALPTHFRGHLTADIVPSLRNFGLPASPPPPPEFLATGNGFLVLDKREIVPNMHLLKIEAPQVANFARPGQFVMLMTRETSERAPFTLVDWDSSDGSITLIIEEVGRSTRELAALKAGDRLAHVGGPLGLPLHIEEQSTLPHTVVLGGGCYGIGAIHPLARALRRAGNTVICIIEASTTSLLYMQEELAAVCDRLIIATKDGSSGIWGGVQEATRQLVAQGTSIDQFIAVGCTFMMRMMTEITRELGIPTQVALNPIMVDGTGMCGACRVSVGEATRFACIDGPFFDAHSVDWDELDARRSAYLGLEVRALPQGADLSALMWKPPQAEAKSGCDCG